MKLPAVALGQQAAEDLFTLPANVQNALTYEFRGMAKERKGDVDGAMADFNQAVQLNPKYPVAYNKG